MLFGRFCHDLPPGQLPTGQMPANDNFFDRDIFGMAVRQNELDKDMWPASPCRTSKDPVSTVPALSEEEPVPQRRRHSQPPTPPLVVETPSPKRKSPRNVDISTNNKITPPKPISSPSPSPGRLAKKRQASPPRTQPVPNSPRTASPKRRIRNKMPLAGDDHADEAVVPMPVPSSPARQALVSGPAPSFSKLLKRLDNPSLVPMAPLKKPRIGRWAKEMRGTALFEVSSSITQSAPNLDSPGPPRRYPRRSTRIPPLEFWRGERLVYNRPTESEAPSVSKIVYNCAARSENLPERSVPALGVPLITDDSEDAEFYGISSDGLSTKLVVLPPWQRGRRNPPTYIVPALSIGMVYVTEGSLRYTLEGENDLAILNAGDALKLPGSEKEALFASAGACGTSTGAKFKVIIVKGHAKDVEDPPPLTL